MSDKEENTKVDLEIYKIDLEKVAIKALKECIAHSTDYEILPGVSCIELAVMAVSHIMTCPNCGAEAWVNVDCELCNTIHNMLLLCNVMSKISDQHGTN